MDDYINPVVDMEGGRYQMHSYSLKNKTLILQPLGSCRNSVNSKMDLEQIKNIIGKVCGIMIKTIKIENINN